MLLTHLHPSLPPTCAVPVGTLSSTHTMEVPVDAMTTCDSTALDDPALLALPAYRPEIACVPIANALVAQVAVRLLPVPLNATAPQPLIVAPAAVNATVPVVALPVTLAVNVTMLPAVDGFAELTSIVVVGAGPAVPRVTLTVSAVEVEPRTSNVTP